jgi:hypothetical protein
MPNVTEGMMLEITTYYCLILSAIVVMIIEYFKSKDDDAVSFLNKDMDMMDNNYTYNQYF